MSATLRIGLTGGIASGKSAVADMFMARGIQVIDTDLLAREVVEPGQPGLAAVAATFGEQFLNSDGSLDRGKLRQQVFADSTARVQLEAIMHPLILAATHEYARATDSPYLVIAVPLLAETGFDAELNRILVIDCPAELQLERLMQRDSETEASARNILAAQASRAARLAIADDVISNTGSLADLETEVGRLHEMYMDLSNQAVDQADGPVKPGQ
jgi:dephospho-CoA kinase